MPTQSGYLSSDCKSVCLLTVNKSVGQFERKIKKERKKERRKERKKKKKKKERERERQREREREILLFGDFSREKEMSNLLLRM